MDDTVPLADSLPLCPDLSIPNSSTPLDWDNAASCCWVCSVLCCCFPLCYPCYLSRTARRRSKREKKQTLLHSQTRTRNERGQEAYRRSEPVETGQTRVTTTMTSEQSTGTSGYATLLSRQGTLHTLLPNVHQSQIQESLVRNIDSSSRKNINAVLISTKAAGKFLRDSQLSELFQGFAIQEKHKSDPNHELFIHYEDLKKPPSEVTYDKNDSFQLEFSFDSSPSYNFSQSCLQFTEDSEGNHDNLAQKPNIKRISYNMNNNSGQSHFLFNNNLEAITEECQGVFKTVGYVDVAESHFSARVFVTAENDPMHQVCVDPMQLASDYCRQLAVSDLIVIIVGQEDRAELNNLPGQGLIGYISKYWAGFFPALLVEVGESAMEGGKLLDTFKGMFCNLERLAVQDTEEFSGQVFSAVARMLGQMGIRGLNRYL
eukprot:GFUD01044739.1.p1 GENE.GFUD01044739.1~~GFUD01044739.1.p1  ORF type:complete len:430 (+),score=83.78 GFUD01044739.1:93-1382(+)